MSYKTQMEAAKKGIITKQMEIVADKEQIEAEKLRQLIAEGKVVIPANVNHKSLNPEGVGDGLRTKINVNLGISGDSVDYCREMEKVKLAIEYGAEAIMDLSNYGKTQEFREKLIEYSPAMIGTVPMYDAIGYQHTYLILGGIVFAITLIAAIFLEKGHKLTTIETSDDIDTVIAKE